MVGKANHSGAGLTESSALRRTLNRCALPSTSDVGLIIIDSVRFHEEFPLLFNIYPLQYGDELKIPSTLSNMRPSGY